MSKLWHYKDEEGDYRYVGDDEEANIIDDFLSDEKPRRKIPEI
jgi:hypothetical protein